MEVSARPSVCETSGDRAGQAHARADLAEVARKQGRFADAQRQLERAGDALERLIEAHRAAAPSA